MTNKDISAVLQRTAALMELHGENDFKTRSYSSAAFQIEKMPIALAEASPEECKAQGLSDNMTAKVREIAETGTLHALEDLLSQTPEGVVEMLGIKGIGPKKIRVLWQELGLTSLGALKEAATDGKVAKLKGFGEKTQELILEQIAFKRANAGKLHFAKAEPLANTLAAHLRERWPDTPLEIVGQIRRCLDVVDTLSIVLAHPHIAHVAEYLAQQPELVYHEAASNPYLWRGRLPESGLGVEIHLTTPEQFAREVFLQSADAKHLAQQAANGETLRSLALAQPWESEHALYAHAGWAYVAPELREGTFEAELARTNQLPKLLEMSEIKGMLHNHSTYSDGRHSLREMAEHCRALGYEYLGITDHSQTASYAGGLKEDRIRQQHEEIDRLNEELAPFRIFKGIESDILNDGRLDYPDAVLASFDFIVASIHGNLKMSEEKAMERLLRAIENPYTTILGHPTGRMLLKREGYPVAHEKLIEACAKHGVVIEINANPWRLDLDWRWVQPALAAGVRLSVNPDAHEKDGYAHTRYGVLVGRKGGLTAAQNLNSLSRDELATYFAARKAKV